VELNFEREPGLRRHFESNDPRRILAELSLARGQEIDVGTALLFLDEIQAASELLAKLRWFFEELPALPVIAAGSLLEFALASPTFSVPVGRIGFRHVEPMGFAEYLEAHGEDRLLAAIRSWRPGAEPSAAAHERASDLFDRYAMVGGMPAVVAADVEGRPPSDLRELQRELAATYRTDFTRYSGRMDRDVLDSVLLAVAGSVGRKFVYAHVGREVKQQQARRGLELLTQARIVHQARHSAANGLPLGAEVKEGRCKAVLADVGLLHALLGTPAGAAFPHGSALAPALRGQLAEQLAAQQVRLFDDGAGDGPGLFYWHREGGRPGEIDFLLQLHGRIVPLELKAGAAGAMKSLHQFMFDKHLDLAVRCDSNPPSMLDVAVRTTRGDAVSYRLLGVPQYLLHHLPVLLEDQGHR
jgi:predicted AAA+ superfamily ATPase